MCVCVSFSWPVCLSVCLFLCLYLSLSASLLCLMTPFSFRVNTHINLFSVFLCLSLCAMCVSVYVLGFSLLSISVSAFLYNTFIEAMASAERSGFLKKGKGAGGEGEKNFGAKISIQIWEERRECLHAFALLLTPVVIDWCLPLQVLCVAWRPNHASQITSCSLIHDFQIHVWDLQRDSLPLLSFQEHTNAATSMYWDTDGANVLVSCGKVFGAHFRLFSFCCVNLVADAVCSLSDTFVFHCFCTTFYAPTFFFVHFSFFGCPDFSDVACSTG